VRQLVIELGSAMVAAGDAVDSVEGTLRIIGATYGVTDVQIAVLPTSLCVETGSGTSSYVQFSSHVAPPSGSTCVGQHESACPIQAPSRTVLSHRFNERRTPRPWLTGW
jgi:Putative threonine/serine exporter